MLQTLAGPDRGLWLARQRQQELMFEAAQERLIRTAPILDRRTPVTAAGRVGLYGAITFGQGQLSVVRQLIAPDPCTDCADCTC